MISSQLFLCFTIMFAVTENTISAPTIPAEQFADMASSPFGAFSNKRKLLAKPGTTAGDGAKQQRLLNLALASMLSKRGDEEMPLDGFYGAYRMDGLPMPQPRSVNAMQNKICYFSPIQCFLDERRRKRRK